MAASAAWPRGGASLPAAAAADVDAISARLDALAADVASAGGASGGAGRPRSTSRGRVRWDAGPAAAPAGAHRSHTRSRSRSRSRSTSRARIAAGGDPDEPPAEEEAWAEAAERPQHASLFADLELRAARSPTGAAGWAVQRGPRGERLPLGVTPAATGAPAALVEARRNANATLPRAGLAPVAAAAADSPEAGERLAARRAVFDWHKEAGVAQELDATRRPGQAPPAPPPRRAPPAAREAAAAPRALPAPFADDDEPAPPPQAGPDRAAALGEALAEIVRARSDRDRFGATGADALSGGVGGAVSAAWARRLASPAEQGGGGGGGGHDANALNALLVEQGKFRPTAAALAAREAEWEATAGGSAAAAAPRRAALAAARDARSPGRPRAGSRGHSRGGSSVDEAAYAALLLRRTASREAVESAGVSVVRALSGGMPPSARAGSGDGSRPGSGGAAAAVPQQQQQQLPPLPPRVRSRQSPPSADDYPVSADAKPAGHAAAEAAAAAAASSPGAGIGAAAGGLLRVVAGYGDGSLRVWRASDGAQLASARGGEGRGGSGGVRAVAVLAGGAVAVSAGGAACGAAEDARGALRVWTLAPTAVLPAALLRPEAGGAPVLALAALDTRRLAAADADGDVLLWNVPGRSCDLTLRGASGAVRCLVPLPAAELAAGGDDGCVRIWGTWDGALERELRGHGAAVLSLAALDAGKVLASGAADGAVRLWSVESGECLAHLAAAHPAARVVALCDLVGGRLASAGSDGQLAVWQPQQGKRDASLRWRAAHGAPAVALTATLLRLGAAHVAAGCSDGSLRLWRSSDNEAVAMLLPDDDTPEEDDETDAAADVPAGVTALALAGGAPPANEAPRAQCGPARVRDRLWCFAGGSRLC